MTFGSVHFDRFVLDPGDRLLSADGERVELNGRYFDALVLLVRDQGRLVSKERFLDEVWRGVPVTDEALTQCIRTLRRQLGDDAAKPRFIETVPKHGYRFIMPVVAAEDAAPVIRDAEPSAPPALGLPWPGFARMGVAGTLGAGLAGALGGLFYGFVGASEPTGAGSGAVSVLLVLSCLTIAAALTGGAGVSFGIGAASVLRSRAWLIAGGALGGMMMGGVVKLLGLDAFNLLLGRSPGDITGGQEGFLLGGSVGLGAWLASYRAIGGSLRRVVAVAGAAGAVGGVMAVAAGGRLMGGSLSLLAGMTPDSRLNAAGGLFAAAAFSPMVEVTTAALEGGLFGGCIVGAMHLAAPRHAPPDGTVFSAR